MGKSVIGSVTEQMMALFASNLQAMLAEPEAAAGTAVGPGDGTIPAAEGQPASAGSAPSGAGAAAGSAPAAVSAPAAPGSPAPAPASSAAAGGAPSAGSSLDAFSLAKGIAADQLASPGRVLGLVAAVALLAYWAGRRSAFRMLRLCGRL